VWTRAKNAALESNAAAKRDADGIHHQQVSLSLSLSLVMYKFICLIEIFFIFVFH
jgi:hypothetical protein